MKLLIAVLLAALLLTGCTAVPPSLTTAPTESGDTLPSQSPSEAEAETAAPVLTENSAWIAYGASEDALAVVVNAPFSRELTATVTWYEGEYELAYIIPRYVGSYVNLYPVTWDETTYTEIVGDKALQSTRADDGCIIFSALTRPEGPAMYYLEVQAPDGAVAGQILAYNGNTGTPPEEFLSPQ